MIDTKTGNEVDKSADRGHDIVKRHTMRAVSGALPSFGEYGSLGP